jgi:hypothetical protein
MYRKPHRRSKSEVLDAVPLFRRKQIDATTLMFVLLMDEMGVTDIPSYFQKLRTWIAAAVVICAALGTSWYGLNGFIWGALAGIAAPAGLLWLGVVLGYALVYLAVFFAACAVLPFLLYWLLRS